MSAFESFVYVCADPGIPVPGTKGASIHVQSVCKALTQLGVRGSVYTVRPKGKELEGHPVHSVPLVKAPDGETPSDRERRLFLSANPAAIGTQEESKPGFVYERYSLWHTAGLSYARQLGVPFVLEVNSPLPDEASRYRSLGQPELAEGVAGVLMKEADAIVCVSSEVAAWVRHRRGKSDGVWVIPNGVDSELFAPCPESRPGSLPPRDVPLVAFSGSFRPWHGLGHLLNAFEILLNDLPEAHLVCVGDGPELESFTARVAERKLTDRVHLPGRVAHDQVPAWLGGADVAVAPYPALDDFYFSPLKIFEFMALGLPVVASATGQIRELIPHEERGYLYGAGDSQELATTLVRTLREQKEAKAIGERGRDWILEHATWQKRVEEILDRLARL